MLFLCANLTRFLRVFGRQTDRSFLPCLYLLHSSALNFQIRANDLKSRLNSPELENLTPLSVQESLFGKLNIH